MTDEGWLPAYRRMFKSDHWLAPSGHCPASRLHAWLDLCQMATHKSRQTRHAALERGQLLVSVRTLGDRWAWSKSRVERFISELEARTAIGTVCGTPDGTIYQIVNYDTYAVGSTNVGDSKRDTERDSSGTAAGQEQEGKKETRTSKPWRICPEKWQPTEKHRTLALELQVSMDHEETKFREHEFKVPKTDADRAFFRWLRTAATGPVHNGNGNGHRSTPAKLYDLQQPAPK